MLKFLPGDIVEIRATDYPRWNGQRGVVVEKGDGWNTWDYIYVKVPGRDFGIGGWLPQHLVLTEPTREQIEQETGEGYLD